MQITKEIINNLEIRSRLDKIFGSLRSLTLKWRQIIISKLKTILLVCLISFTSLLVRQTLQIQHSCLPMLHSGILPAKCQIAIKNNLDLRDLDETEIISNRQKTNVEKQPDKQQKIANSPIKKQPQIAQSNSKSEPHKITFDSQVTEPKISPSISQLEPKYQSNSVGQFISEHSDDIVGGIAGVAGGAGVMAAAGATAVLSVPVAGAVLIGLGIWYAIRTVF